MEWTEGLPTCNIAEPLVTSAYSTAAQVLRPAGRHVTTILWPVSKDGPTGPAGATGGPYVMFWGGGPDGAPGTLTLPATLTGYGEITIAEQDVTFNDMGSNGHIGIANIPVDLTLQPGEVLWVGSRLDPQVA